MTSYRHTPILFISGFGGFVFWLNTVTYVSDLSDNCMHVTPDLMSLTYVITHVFIRTAYLYGIAVICTLMGEYFSILLCGVENTIRGKGVRCRNQDTHGDGSSFEQSVSHLFERVWSKMNSDKVKDKDDRPHRKRGRESNPEVIVFE